MSSQSEDQRISRHANRANHSALVILSLEPSTQNPSQQSPDKSRAEYKIASGLPSRDPIDGDPASFVMARAVRAGRIPAASPKYIWKSSSQLQASAKDYTVGLVKKITKCKSRDKLEVRSRCT
jgi:hypothetical protein